MYTKSMLENLLKEFKSLASAEKAKASGWFFKTGEGQYGYGDEFIGVTVPEQRKLAKKYQDLPLKDIQELLSSKIHEHRLTALFILVGQYQKAQDAVSRGKLADFYLQNLKGVNNWDLVDSSAPYILGDWLLKKDKTILYQLAKSQNMWSRRVAVLGAGGFISQGEFGDVLKISEILLTDKEDLIHKAVGWMLREVGKRDFQAEEGFLNKHYKSMPRTMLRYAIEKFTAEKKAYYMRKA